MDKKWIGENNQALLLPRVSTRKQNSSTQINEMKEYCQYNGLRMTKTIEVKESAKDSDKRCGYNKAINFALKNNIRHLIFLMDDREARNLTDVETNEKLVMKDKLVIHYVLDRKIIHKHSPDSDFFMRDMKAAINKNFSRSLGTRMDFVMREKAESGWYPGNRPPLGYVPQRKKDENGKELKRDSIIAIDPLDKNVRQVQREFELRVRDGVDRPLPLEEIRNQIIAENYILPSKIPNYHVSGIEKRLKNVFYDDRFIWKKKVYDGKHERIISKQLWNDVQNTFGKRSMSRHPNGIFGGGWMKCATPECGCFITSEPKSKEIKKTKEIKTYHLYRCSNGKKIHKSFAGMYAHEEDLWMQFEKAVDSISITKSFAEELAKALNETQHKAVAATRREAASYNEALKKLEDQEDEAYLDYKKGVLDEKGHRRRIEKVRSERLYYSQQLEGANVAIANFCMENAKTIIELATNAKSLWLSRSAQERREFLNDILSNQVLEGVNVRYEMKKPFVTISQMSGNENWRPHGDSNPGRRREKAVS